MTCDRVTMPGGVTAIVCSTRRRKRCGCGRPATLECDWKVPTRKSGTCDAPICASCTTSPAPDKDLCPEHAKAFEAWRNGRMSENDIDPELVDFKDMVVDEIIADIRARLMRGEGLSVADQLNVVNQLIVERKRDRRP